MKIRYPSSLISQQIVLLLKSLYPIVILSDGKMDIPAKIDQAAFHEHRALLSQNSNWIVDRKILIQNWAMELKYNEDIENCNGYSLQLVILQFTPTSINEEADMFSPPYYI